MDHAITRHLLLPEEQGRKRVFWGLSRNRIGAMEREGISQGTGTKIGSLWTLMEALDPVIIVLNPTMRL